jgi:phage terminase large subunit-like protein
MKGAARWMLDPVCFIREVLRDPQTGQPFVLYEAEERFFREAFTLTSEGELRCSEIVFSAPKKSGKTCIGAWAAIYVAAVIGGLHAEVYCLSNDYEQSQGRVFEQARRIIEASPLLSGTVKVTAGRLEFIGTGSFIQACASDYSGFAGSNPSLTIYDELWGYVHEAARRLYDEGVPSPTRRVSARMVTTYAGFAAESVLLEGLYNRLLAGESLGDDFYRNRTLYGCWTHELRAPWQSDEWAEQMAEQMRPNAFARMILNQWVSAESSFVSMADWDACTDREMAQLWESPTMPVWVGLDASWTGDQTAIVVCGWESSLRRVRILWHKAIQPSRDRPIDFEKDIAVTLRELRKRYNVREIRCDPRMLEPLIQPLMREGLPMVVYTQSLPNLTVCANNLHALVRSRGLVTYPADDLRQSVLSTVIDEGEHGLKLSKLKQSHRIDLCVALSMAALAAVEQHGTGSEYVVSQWDGTPFERDPDIPNGDIGITDRDGNLLPEVEAAKAARLRGN